MSSIAVMGYPADLAELVRQRWASLQQCSGSGPVAKMCILPEPEAFAELLSTAYQASLLREEERPVSFRLIVAAPQAFPAESGPPDGLQRLVFSRPRPLTPHELRRLSPAAKYHRSLIGIVRDADGQWTIWGILHSGPRWLDDVRGSRRAHPTLPSARLVIHATGPGQIAVASGSIRLGEIRGGSTDTPGHDVFASTWLSAMFRAERAELMAIHEQARAAATEPWAELDVDLARVLSQQMLKRLLATVRSMHHGGTLVILPPESAEHEVTRGALRLKYAFVDDEPRRRFRTLMLGIMRALAETHGRVGGATDPPIGWRAYGASDHQLLGALDEAVFEISHLVAGLADVDGAVVMTKRFEVLGFGAEIVSDSSEELRTVRRALDLEGEHLEEENIEGVGTRHRSAYRLCCRARGAVVLVVSHDGTVRFVTWREGGVVYWDHGVTDLSEGG
ncbi:MAG: uncharacterized protein JWP97_1174 [Labilithrix sp.]|nr:uncharacterized protein [Labilithrix sp.]